MPARIASGGVVHRLPSTTRSEPGEVARDRNGAVSGRREHVRHLLRLPVADLEHEETRARGAARSARGSPRRAARARLVVQLGLQPLERVDVRRVRDDEIPAGGRALEPAFAQLDVEAERLRVLARERERVLRDVDSDDLRVGALVLQRERDRARSRRRCRARAARRCPRAARVRARRRSPSPGAARARAHPSSESGGGSPTRRARRRAAHAARAATSSGSSEPSTSRSRSA